MKFSRTPLIFRKHINLKELKINFLFVSWVTFFKNIIYLQWYLLISKNVSWYFFLIFAIRMKIVTCSDVKLKIFMIKRYKCLFSVCRHTSCWNAWGHMRAIFVVNYIVLQKFEFKECLLLKFLVFVWKYKFKVFCEYFNAQRFWPWYSIFIQFGRYK